MDKVYIVKTENLYEMEECPTGIDSIWTSEKKAIKRCAELQEQCGDPEAWSIEYFKVSK